MPSSKKTLANGETNPAYQADRHKTARPGDRHRPGYKRPKHPCEALERKYFVAWDGEGTTDKEGRHHYNYLASSHGHEALSVRETLSTVSCFELLLQGKREHPDAIHVIFSGSYDVNMMLVDVPRLLLEELYQGTTIIWGAYEIKYIPRKELWIAREGESMRLWDVFGFFQAPFVRALKEYGIAEPGELEYIEGMKRRRGTFTTREFKREVVPYCQKELDLLKRLMHRLKEYLVDARLPISRWDGAGAIAATILKQHRVADARGQTIDALERASSYAYSGGRIECLQYGHYDGRIYHYDLRSAYPAAMLHCPDLSRGHWSYYKVPGDLLSLLKEKPFSVWHVRYNFREGEILYPFSHRDLHGQISYPSRGETWVWSPELIAAIENRSAWSPESKEIQILEGWAFTPSGEPRYPFDFLPDLFAIRKKWKEEGNGAEKVLKLGINSLYGKTIQKQGYDETRGNIPPFFQLQWAGYITSATRAKLYRAAMQAPDAVLCLATDGIFATRPLELEIGPELGQWEASEHAGMTLVQSGVYWYSNDDGSERAYYRGFDKDSLSREKVLAAWSHFEHSLPVRSTRFITLGSALIGDRWSLWRTWHTIERVLALDFSQTAKRKDGPIQTTGDYLWGLVSPARELKRTYPRVGLGDPSQPYKLPWQQQYEETIDGDIPARLYLMECEETNA